MKTLTLIFWLVLAVALLGFIPEPIAFWLKIVGLFLLVAHAIEFIVFKKAIKAKGDSGLKSFIMTMVYGVFYFKF